MTQANPAIQDAVEPISSDLPSITKSAQAILVLGMHRSGTSALARVLNLLGVELGTDLLPPAADNEMGFWEHRQVQFIHDRIYEDLGCDWTNVSSLPPQWWERPEIQPRREQLREILQQDFGRHKIWGIKDPRLCSMLPLWRPLLEEMHCQPKCVMIFRNPKEVAKSLEKRDKISVSRAYLLWLRSVIESEQFSRHLPRMLTTFDRLIADWQGQIAQIGSSLQLAWPTPVEQVTDAVAEFIRPSSRHHHVEDHSFLTDENVPEQIRRMYGAILSAAESGEVDQLSETVDQIAGELEHAQPLLTHFVKDLEAETRSIVIDRNKDAMRLHGEIGGLQQSAAASAAQIAMERDASIKLSSELQATTADLAANNAKLSQAEIDLARLNELTITQRESIGHKNLLVDTMRGEQIQTNKQLTNLLHEKRNLQAELSQTYRTRDTLGPSLQRLWKSNLWRFGRPAWLLARALGKLNRGMDDLIPLTEIQRESDGSWHGSTFPHFLIPIVPMKGWVRVRARIESAVSSRACIYFDTGNSFNQAEHIELAAVAGVTEIDRMLPLRSTAIMLRFDPIQAAGEFSVREFLIEPMSSLWFNIAAVLGNFKKTILGDGSHRPSILVGLKLLLTGDWLKFHAQLVNNIGGSTAVSEYDLWRRRHEITEVSRAKMRDQISQWVNPPKISIIMPVYNVPETYLRKCIDSVLRQIYPNWELCIADDASPKLHIKKVLQEYAAKDPRVRAVFQPVNGGISTASNAALQLTTGSYIALLDHDDEISEHALFKVAEALMEDPSIDMIYSDEDKLTAAGKHHDPFFKPDWSPEYFLSCMYTCHLGAYRAALVKQIGGWRKEFDSAQDYDLVLRITETGAKVHHIPDVLYHWRTLPSSTAANNGAKPEAHQRAQCALQDHLNRSNRPGTVLDGPGEGFHRIRYQIKGNPKVSIVIPSACRTVEIRGRKTWFVLDCVASIRRLSTYQNIEIIVLDNDDMSAELAEALSPFDIRKISFTEPFNLARKMNLGGSSATGEHLILLNDDIEVITPGWIEAMLEFSQWDEIGAVGAQLVFPDDTLQHNGVNILEGNPGHPFYQFPADHPGYYNSSVVNRNWSAVTGACLMTRKNIFKSVGGFSEKFPLNYNDVDYCLKVNGAGKRVVYTPYAKLYHHESVSKAGTDLAELEAFKNVWGSRIPRDPYYNPNLTMQACDFRIG